MKYQIERLLRIYKKLNKREKALVLTIGAFIGLIVIGNILNLQTIATISPRPTAVDNPVNERSKSQPTTTNYNNNLK